MTDHKALVERLRDYNSRMHPETETIAQAADAIEQLVRERDEALPYVEAFRREELRADKEAMRADDAERERDAIDADLDLEIDTSYLQRQRAEKAERERNEALAALRDAYDGWDKLKAERILAKHEVKP